MQSAIEFRNNVNENKMIKFKKLTKVKNDIVWLNPKTMEKLCSLNECINKFDSVVDETFMREYPRTGETLQVVQQSHVCKECGRKYASRTDKHQNYKLYLNARMTGASNPNEPA